MADTRIHETDCVAVWNGTPISASELPRTVYVRNISARATEKNTRQFFAYCGNIDKLVLHASAAGDTQHAIVTFAAPSGFTTALLLSNASIIDRLIVVVPFSLDADGACSPGAAAAAAATTAAAGTTAAAAAAPVAPVPGVLPAAGALAAAGDDPHSLAAPAPAAADEPPRRSATAVLAEMTAAGYVFSAGVVQRAREFDDASLRLEPKVAAAMVYVQAAGQALGRSLDQHLMPRVESSVVALDRRFGLAAMLEAAELTIGSVLHDASQTRPVAAGTALLQSAGEALDSLWFSFVSRTSAALDRDAASATGAAAHAPAQP